MTRHILAFIFFVAFGLGTSDAQENSIEKKNLQSDWLVNNGSQYTAFQKADLPLRTIYFSVKPDNFRGDYLFVTDRKEFSLLINGKLLIDQTKKAVLSLDSLQRIFPESTFFVAVHGSENVNPETLHTVLFSKVVVANLLAEEKQLPRKTSFRDFVVIGILILFIFLVGVIRLNPRLSSDYFSVTKLFSLRDTDSDQFYYRITSGNILFYLLISLALAFVIILIGQFVEIGIRDLTTADFSVSMLIWLRVCLVIFAFLFIKMFLVHTVASLFGIREIAGFHFFNFTRLLLVSVGLLTLVIGTYNLLRGQQPEVYNVMLNVLTWITGGWVILLFLKLTNRVTYAVFHLFSYICATEIIPFLLIVKVLNE
jgi:hypothetical protein